MFENPVVIIDNASHTMKAGFSCDNHPISMFRNVVGRPAGLNGQYGKVPYEILIGDEAVLRCGDYDLYKPLEDGKVVSWDNMERIWHHVYYRELKVAPEERAVLLTVPTFTTLEEKNKCCQVLFESLNCAAICVKDQAVMALNGSGCGTGISIDIGFYTSEIVAIYLGRIVKHTFLRTGLAGLQVVENVQASLSERGIETGLQGEHQDMFIQDFIKKEAYVTLDQCCKRTDRGKKLYTLPTGRNIDVGIEAFNAGECFFEPDLVVQRETKYWPLHKAILHVFRLLDPEIASEMCDFLVMSGGYSMMPGLAERLRLEVTKTRPVTLVTSDESYVLSWMGAAMFAGMEQGQQQFVTRKKWDEKGIQAIRTIFG